MDYLADALQRTRQHHAIEHATIHILSRRHPTQRFTGFSDPLGFTIHGDLDEYDLRTAVGDALLRLQGGERELAIHPNCGTNMLTTALMATLAGIMARIFIRKGWLERFAATLILTLVAIVGSKPIGFRVQEYTTDANVSDRWVKGIRLIQLGDTQLLRVNFE